MTPVHNPRRHCSGSGSHITDPSIVVSIITIITIIIIIVLCAGGDGGGGFCVITVARHYHGMMEEGIGLVIVGRQDFHGQ